MAAPQVIERFHGEHAFLSNFYYAPIHYEGERYDTVEHAFQAMKTLDGEERRQVREASTPGQAKRMGRKVQLRGDWESIKLSLMKELLSLKFQSHPELRALLLETGDAELIEGNTWNDRFWGVCRGQGKNHLGKLLMEIRDELKMQ